MKITVKNVPEMTWMSDYARYVVEEFNTRTAKLQLDVYCDTAEELPTALEDGMFDYIYPETTMGMMLKDLIEDAAKYPRYLYFTVADVETA